MRLRPLAVLSLAVVSALALAGCAGAAEPEDTPTPSGDAAASECLVDAQPGAVSDAISVSGSGADLAATFSAGTEPAEIERTIVTEGDGDELRAGDVVSGVYAIYDGVTGELLERSADSAAGADGEIPLQLDPQQYSVFVAALECAPLGSTAALAIPGSAFGEGRSSIVIVAQSIDKLTRADGADQEPVEGMPTVELADDGTPSITVPDADAPTEVQLAELKQGDGPVVEPGDNVTVQYTGVKWSDGEEFDSSWGRGAPTSFPTSGVVDGFRQALEGYAVGSQVLVVVPPAAGYGASPTSELKDETLVFVVDILGTQRAIAAAG